MTAQQQSTKTEKVYYLVREGMWQSIASDTFSFLTVMAMIGVGWFLGIEPLEWVGALLFMFGLFGDGPGKRMTPDEIRADLDKHK